MYKKNNEEILHGRVKYNLLISCREYNLSDWHTNLLLTALTEVLNVSKTYFLSQILINYHKNITWRQKYGQTCDIPEIKRFVEKFISEKPTKNKRDIPFTTKKFVAREFRNKEQVILGVFAFLLTCQNVFILCEGRVDMSLCQFVPSQFMISSFLMFNGVLDRNLYVFLDLKLFCSVQGDFWTSNRRIVYSSRLV